MAKQYFADMYVSLKEELSLGFSKYLSNIGGTNILYLVHSFNLYTVIKHVKWLHRAASL